MAEKKMIIDGVSCPFTTERNVLEVARNNGIDIPSLCYCENLSIYGGCRLCLVENDRGKMDAACSMQPRDGMVVNTHTKQVHNQVTVGKRNTSMMNFKVNIFSIGLGMAFYL